MFVLIFLIWIILFFSLPAALLITATITYAAGVEKFKVIGKLLIAFAGQFLTTLIMLYLILLLIVGAEPRRSRSLELSTGEELTALFALFGYAVAGWLLCSFINGKLIKSWTYFSLDSHGKPPTILGVK